VSISISDDGVNFEQVKQLTHNVSDKKEGMFKHIISSDFNFKTRYVKVKAENYGILPDWHPAAGVSAWLFVDEIMIQ
jgi:hypothetical protein